MLSAEQNGSQSEEINVIDESRAEGRPVPVQGAEIRWKKVVSLVCQFASVLCLAAAQILSRLGELHVKAGYVSTLQAGKPG